MTKISASIITVFFVWTDWITAHPNVLQEIPFRSGSRTVYSETNIYINATLDKKRLTTSIAPSGAEVMHTLHGNNIWENLSKVKEWASSGIKNSALFSPTPAPMFMKNIVNKTDAKFIVEVGSFVGGSTIILANALDAVHAQDTRPFVLSVDTWLGDAYMWSSKANMRSGGQRNSYKNLLNKAHGYPQLYKLFVHNILKSKASHRVVPLPLSSNEAARVLDYFNFRPDLVYIDASHDAIDVLQDLEHFFTLLRCDGTLFGDDFNWQGVRAAVLHFIKQRSLSLKVFHILNSPERAMQVNKEDWFSVTGNTKWVVEKKRC